MFLNSTFSAIEGHARRQALLDQAEHHRLVKLARAGTRVTTPAPPPSSPRGPRETVPSDKPPENRRYAVSR